MPSKSNPYISPAATWRGLELYYAVLSGIHLPLALEELRSILDVEADIYAIKAVIGNVAIFEAQLARPEIVARRAGLIREVGTVVALSDEWSSDSLVEEIVRALDRQEVRIEVHRLFGAEGPSEREVVLALCDRLRCSLRAERELSIIFSEGAMVAGIPLARSSAGDFEERKPRRRPFFKPGSMEPRLSRLFVNLSRLRKGGVYLDPFCGSGGFAIEACSMGAGLVICGDVDWRSSLGAKANLERYGCGGRYLTLISDAASLPLVEADSIATDPPYGRSSSTAGRSYRDLVLSFLLEAKRVARAGSFVVFAGSHSDRPATIAEEAGLVNIRRFHMFVHGTLVREIVVARVRG